MNFKNVSVGENSSCRIPSCMMEALDSIYSPPKGGGGREGEKEGLSFGPDPS